MIRTATVIPDNERWLHEAQAASDLARAVKWSTQNPASDSQTDTLLAAVAQTPNGRLTGARVLQQRCRQASERLT